MVCRARLCDDLLCSGILKSSLTSSLDFVSLVENVNVSATVCTPNRDPPTLSEKEISCRRTEKIIHGFTPVSHYALVLS